MKRTTLQRITNKRHIWGPILFVISFALGWLYGIVGFFIVLAISVIAMNVIA